jgi:hypothetical protein
MDFLEQKLRTYRRPSEPEHSPDCESEKAFREERLTWNAGAEYKRQYHRIKSQRSCMMLPICDQQVPRAEYKPLEPSTSNNAVESSWKLKLETNIGRRRPFC